MSDKWIRFLALLGLVILLFGIIGGFFIGHTHPIMLSHMIVGILCLAAWYLLYGMKNAGSATKVITGRRSRFGVNAVLYGTVFLGILACINWIGTNEKYNLRWDFTEEGVFSLSDQSIKAVENLKKPLKLVAFNVGGGDPSSFDLVKLYDYQSEKVKVEIVDPNAKPHLVEKYGMKQGNVLYLAYGDENQLEGESRVNDLTENTITNAILKLTKGAAKKVYYLVGQDEPSLEDGSKQGFLAFAEAIRDEHINIEPLALAQAGKVPEDAAAVIVVAPKKPMFPEEKEALIKYGDNGGKLLLMKEPTYPNTSTDVVEIASHYGIEVRDDLVLDAVTRLFAGPSMAVQFVASAYEPHPITMALPQRDKPILNMASSVTVKSDAPKDATYTEIIKTSDKGWGETDLKTIFTQSDPTVSFDSSDVTGPLSLAVAYESKAEEGKSPTRLLVFGDTDWASNSFIQFSVHRDLLLNSINWLIGEVSNITIRPKKFKANYQRLPRETFYIILGSGFFVPELILILGLVIWWRRKTS